VLNTGLIAGAVAFEEGGSVFTIWRRHFFGLWLTFFGGASIAALLIEVMRTRDANIGVVALLLPLPIILYFTFKRAVDRMHDQLADLGRVNEMYRSLIEGAVYGILRTSLEGQFIDVNRALTRMLGYGSNAELLAKNLWSEVLVDPSDRTRMLTPPAGSAQMAGLEMWWLRKDGSRVLVRVSGRLVGLEQQELAALELMVEDVTDRRTLEEQLQQAQKLDAIGRLARGVAHDFNNLLTVIVGSGELIGQDLPPDHPAQVEVRELLRASHTAASLTRQLLAFSRQQLSRPEQVDVNEVIREMTGLVQRLAGEAVVLDVSLHDRLPPIVADRGQLEQVVMNLAINARDAMPDGGCLSIETFPASRDGEAATEGRHVGDYVAVRVSDTGVGMSAEVQAHIFEPFFTTKENGKGSGLGLATVYGIVKQSGGEIYVVSGVHSGTSFTLCLPARVAITQLEQTPL
jgi:PAS domain S-box-containing protein